MPFGRRSCAIHGHLVCCLLKTPDRKRERGKTMRPSEVASRRCCRAEVDVGEGQSICQTSDDQRWGNSGGGERTSPELGRTRSGVVGDLESATKVLEDSTAEPLLLVEG